MTPRIETLLQATRDLLTVKAADLALTAETIASIQPWKAVEPAVLPVHRLLNGIPALSGPETRAVTEALVAAAPDLAWRQTYGEEDGFDERFLQTYGWCDLAGPDGPCQADGIRVMMGYWGQGLTYPDHSHPPDEHYLVLAGGAWFRLGDAPFRHLGPGDIFHTPARAVHSAQMRDGPLVAMAIWRAEDLSVRINLTDANRNVSL